MKGSSATFELIDVLRNNRPLPRTTLRGKTAGSCRKATTGSTAAINELTKKGTFYEGKGQLQAAQECLEGALALLELAHGLEHPRAPMILLMLARLFRLNGNQAEAALLSDKARVILENGAYVAPPGGSSGFWSLLAIE